MIINSKFNPENYRDQNSRLAKLNFKFEVLNFKLLFIIFSTLSCTSRGTKYDQYFAQGQTLYAKNCSNCHQKNGKGLGLVYPPLSPSDYLDQNFSASLCLMKYGKSGEIIVNKKNFNKPMPGVPSLTELEIAEIGTYIYNSWGSERGVVEIQEVKKALEECGSK